MPFRTLLVVAVAARSAVRTDEIDGAICAWANERSVEEAMISLQAARLDAGVVRRPADLLGGPHLLARGFWRSVERNYMTYPPTTPGHSRGRTPFPYVILPEPLARAMHMPSRKCSAEIAALKDAEIIGTMLFIAEYKRLQRTSA
jgi:crotonobetainyl-CoA:carnitine CoA-transferase CaiB-like acyl-CoA transferase